MVFDKVYSAVRKRFPEQTGETLVIGIGGNTGSGKSSFTEEFSEFLDQRGISTFIHENDFYQAPRSKKNEMRQELVAQGKDKLDNWWQIVGEEIYYNTYDRELMVKHLEALKARKDIPFVKLYDKQSGEWTRNVLYSFNGSDKPVWVLHDGVYLFHPLVRPHLDQVVLLTTGREQLISDPVLGEITEERRVRFERVAERGLKRGYKVDYYAGFLPLDIQTSKHIRDNVNPETDIIIDNSDYTRRRIISFPER